MRRLSKDDIVRRAPETLASDVGAETVLMSLDGGVYAGLDEMGQAIWRRIEDPVRVADLCADLLAAYDAEPATIEADVLAFLDKLVANKMAERTS